MTRYSVSVTFIAEAEDADAADQEVFEQLMAQGFDDIQITNVEEAG